MLIFRISFFHEHIMSFPNLGNIYTVYIHTYTRQYIQAIITKTTLLNFTKIINVAGQIQISET